MPGICLAIVSCPRAKFKFKFAWVISIGSGRDTSASTSVKTTFMPPLAGAAHDNRLACSMSLEGAHPMLDQVIALRRVDCRSKLCRAVCVGAVR